MKRALTIPLLVSVIALVALAAGPVLAGSPGGGPPDGVVPDHYIVTVHEDASPGEVAESHGLAPQFTYETAIRGFAGFVPPGKLRDLRDDSRVKAVKPDRVVRLVHHRDDHGGGPDRDPPPDDPNGGNQPIPPNIDRVGAPIVWDEDGGLTGAGVGIAILDTGVDRTHRDLRVATAFHDSFGGDCQDKHGHGTHVSGIAAALDNEYDVVGVAPDASIICVKVLGDNGSGTDSSVIAGLDWVKKNAGKLNIRAANASLGRPASDNDDPLKEAVEAVVEAGVVFIAAAGNDHNRDVNEFVPARFAAAVAVASTTAQDGTNRCRRYSGNIEADTASFFTSRSEGVLLVSAPGEQQENINPGCVVTSEGILSLQAGGGTTRMSGTSMAAPHVAGIAALLAQQLGDDFNVGCARDKLSVTERKGDAPLDNPVRPKDFGEPREGIAYAPWALAFACEA